MEVLCNLKYFYWSLQYEDITVSLQNNLKLALLLFYLSDFCIFTHWPLWSVDSCDPQAHVTPLVLCPVVTVWHNTICCACQGLGWAVLKIGISCVCWYTMWPASEDTQSKPVCIKHASFLPHLNEIYMICLGMVSELKACVCGVWCAAHNPNITLHSYLLW